MEQAFSEHQQDAAPPRTAADEEIEPMQDPSQIDEEAYDAFLDALERGSAPSLEAFLSRWPGASEELVSRLEMLARAAAPPPDPELIGSFRVIRRLGAGGMGVVYLAEDPELGRQVAVKVLRRAGSASEGAFARLRREARTLAALDHRSIVRVHALGETDEGRPYVVMESVKGRTLRKELEAGPMPWREALRVCLEIAEALEAAHGRNIVHRDLKPGNVMLDPSGGVKVLDFGLASSPGASAGRASGSTPSGTPGYMSPEQAMGRSCTPADDVWAFGKVMAECLAGSARVDGGTEAPAGVPRALWRFVLGCTSADVSARPADGGAALRALRALAERLLAGGALAPLRPRRTRFVGRADELRAMASAGARVVTLLGPGGVGKSRLAYEFARERQPALAVDLVGASDGEDVPRRLLEAIGHRYGGRETAWEALASAARDGGFGATLVLDGCEHVGGAIARVIDQLLDASPSLRIVATSRMALPVEGQRVVPVEPLDADSALELLRDRAGAAGLGPRGSASDERDLAALCESVDRLPLGIELAAAKLPEVGLRALLDRVGAAPSIVDSAAPRTPAHHGSLEAMVRWSVDRLDPEQAAAFRRLGVFEDGWRLDTAERFMARLGTDPAPTLGWLADLTARSLLRRDQGRDRWGMLDTMKAFARAQCQRAGEEPSTRRALAEVVLDLAEDAIGQSFGDRRLATHLALEEVIAELAPSVAFALEDGATAGRAFNAVAGLFEFWLSRGRPQEGLRLTRLAIASSHVPSDDESAHAHLSLGTYLGRMGRIEEAMEALDTSMAHARAAENPLRIARVHRNIGYFRMLNREYDEAERRYREALAIETGFDDPKRMGDLLNDLGVLHHYRGDDAAAAELYGESLALRRRAGDPWGIASSLGNLGEARQKLGDLKRARGELCESLERFVELGDLRSVAESFEMSADLEIAAGNDRRAAVLTGAAAGLRRSMGIPIPDAESGSHGEGQRHLQESLGAAQHAELVSVGEGLDVEAAMEVALGRREA